MQIQENVALAPLTTFRVGGPARYFVEARSTDDVCEAVECVRSRSLPLFILGGGSNVVISDAGWAGLVLKIGILGISHQQEQDSTMFRVGAGEEWDRFVALAVSRGYGGIECLSGIPGSVGATPVQNVGAYGQEVAETIESVEALDLNNMKVIELPNADCKFSYRTSIFNTTESRRYVILRVSYRLKSGTQPRIAYADLKKYFSGWTTTPTVAETREAVRQIRARKAMLILPGDEDCQSAGSFFKNPVLSSDEFEDLTRRAAARGLRIPSYPALDVQKKVSAAWLVEHSGFSKGFSNGSVAISRKHALAIVNRGHARAADVVAFEEQIRQRVEEIWGIQLHPEPVFVGF